MPQVGDRVLVLIFRRRLITARVSLVGNKAFQWKVLTETPYYHEMGGEVLENEGVTWARADDPVEVAAFLAAAALERT